jgi:hypothetical protein
MEGEADVIAVDHRMIDIVFEINAPEVLCERRVAVESMTCGRVLGKVCLDAERAEAVFVTKFRPQWKLVSEAAGVRIDLT